MFRILAHHSARNARPIRLLQRILLLQALFRQRSTLAQLDDHLLRDIGITRDEARKEVHRSPWDVPPHWRG